MSARIWMATFVTLAVACGTSASDSLTHDSSFTEPDAGSGEMSDAGTGSFGEVDDGGDSGAFVGPTNFVKTQLGGYALGAPLTGDGVATPNAPNAAGDGSCSLLVGVVRDFKGANLAGGHPDFESFLGDGLTPNLVHTIGSDEKPVYASKWRQPWWAAQRRVRSGKSRRADRHSTSGTATRPA